MWQGGIGVVFTVCFFGFAIAGPMGDQCDWTGSGLAVGRSRGVTPVYLRCGEGRLTWLYPRGALRLIFRLPRSPANPSREFRVCLRMLHDKDSTKDVFIADDIETLDNTINIDEDPSNKYKDNNPFPARLFLEEENGLVPLFADSTRSVRCFWSRGGRAAVYVEALPDSAGLERTVARLRYEARPARDAVPYDDECRPCSDDEMALAYCTSDFVGRGIIVGVQDQEDLDTTELTLKLTKLIRNSETAVRDLRRWDITDTQDSKSENLDETRSSNISQELDEFSNEMGPTRYRRGVKRRKWHARVSVPLRCTASGNTGEEFVVMARRRLGSLRLVCAPRLQQWAALIARVNADGSGHCLLGS